MPGQGVIEALYWIGLAVTVIGTVLGYTVSYAVGRRNGPAIRHSWLGRQVRPERWKQAKA